MLLVSQYYWYVNILNDVLFLFCFLGGGGCCFLIEIHSMQGWTATTKHGVTWKRSTKRLKHTGNLFGRNLMMMMMMMMMNCFLWYGWPTKGVSLISSRGHCQRSSPARISDMPQAGFEPVQSLRSDSLEWSCAVVITTTPWHHNTGTAQAPPRHVQLRDVC